MKYFQSQIKLFYLCICFGIATEPNKWFGFSVGVSCLWCVGFCWLVGFGFILFSPPLSHSETHCGLAGVGCSCWVIPAWALPSLQCWIPLLGTTVSDLQTSSRWKQAVVTAAFTGRETEVAGAFSPRGPLALVVLQCCSSSAPP